MYLVDREITEEYVCVLGDISHLPSVCVCVAEIVCMCVPVISLSPGCHRLSTCCHAAIRGLLLYLLHQRHHRCYDFCLLPACLRVREHAYACVMLHNSGVIDHPLSAIGEMCEPYIFLTQGVKRKLYPHTGRQTVLLLTHVTICRFK